MSYKEDNCVWTKKLFGTDKPVIGMMHLLAMPTDPKYDPDGGMKAVIERARKDLHALQNGGIDGILFCNEYSIPYTNSADGSNDDETVFATSSISLGAICLAPSGTSVANV